LPDVVTTLNLNRYEADYAAFGESIRTNGWGFDTALDFSKYLPPTDNGLRSHLKTYYRIDWSKTGFGGFDHALMASFEVDF
jgi:hypothetical protein